MASEVECSQIDCLPPIPSGYYTIVNKVNGDINLPHIEPSEIPVIASHESLIVSGFTDRFTNSSLKVFHLYYSGKSNISRIRIMITSIISSHGILALLSQSRRSILIIVSMWPLMVNLRYGWFAANTTPRLARKFTCILLSCHHVTFSRTDHHWPF